MQFISKRKCEQKRTTAAYATHGQLKLILLYGRGLTHTHTPKTQIKKENGLPWGSVGWLVSWRHVCPSRARTRRRQRRLPRQRSDDDERAGLRHDDECTPRNQPLPELLVHTPISTKSSSSHTRFKARRGEREGREEGGERRERGLAWPLSFC